MRCFVNRIVATRLPAVLVLQMAGLAQQNVGRMPAGEERSKDGTVQVEGRRLPFSLTEPRPMTVEVNGRLSAWGGKDRDQ